ncbi:hypothetical protein TrLO_g10152 [Triparma laevis f. longispina]|uniref:Uncharacterized protein n=1 Tax=Triparma laevis f. longispina TaxID=1714387 RepID=A0A9W7E7U3_9STRA|nr:hypothetical protein TrLO_g10152 [Triparma laevis f. longispina]
MPPLLSLLLPQSSLRTFSSSISSLHKIGRTLFLEATPTHLTLRTLNDTKSSFMRIEFGSDFFLELMPGELDGGQKKKRKVEEEEEEEEKEEEEEEEEEKESFVCQIPSKTVHSVLRHVRLNVLTLRITSSTSPTGTTPDSDSDSDNDDNKEPTHLILSYKTHSGTTLTHSLSMIPSPLTTVYAPINDCSLTSIPSKVLRDLLEHMKKVVEVEVTFEEKRVRFESFEGGGKGFIGSSKASIDASELTQNNFKTDRTLGPHLPPTINTHSTLVFSLRELRSLLLFSSQNCGDENVNVECFYEWGGKPATFRIDGEGFRGELITATMDWKANVKK